MALIGVLTDEWNFGWIGIYLAMLSYGAGNLYAATSTRTGSEQYNDLADKLDNITSQQEELIALVKSTIQTARDEDSHTESPTDANDQP